ncbi:hypothetical protein [Streptomyces mobaraensis]|uniref:Lipoprotein n=1 Tax=Streptomyces mobaraensis TaxID=35621 RepID=A0A5N5W5Q9_STRMB|nr:hypothetical protein [Streptomyces mobaraensis]KAB7842846.1 hypothetical protein FRZ00_19430 [Streptomyces mobaraensis]
MRAMDGPTTRPRGGRRAALRFLAVVLIALPALTGCGAGPVDGAAVRDTDAVRRLLDGWAKALRDRDEGAYLAAVDPGERAYRDRRRQVFANLADVPLASWEYGAVRTGGSTPAPGDGHRVAAEAELRYRLAGYDAAPVSVPVRLTAVRRSGRWYVAGDDTASGDRQLWEQGRVTAVRGRHSLVLGAGREPAALRALSGLADAAVPAVAAAWPDDGRPGRLVVEMPASLERMGALLGAPPSDYRGIAAVTTTAGEKGGGGPVPAGRIVVNPEAYGALSTFGRRAVLTHEATHVATRARTTDTTPMWLSEGFADWVAYRTADRAPAAIAPELTRAVTAGRPPDRLPADADFRFTGGADRLARAYEGAWLACRMVAERWGERKLVAFYRAAGTGSVEKAAREVLGTGERELTAEWRGYVRKVLR